ncbi:MAG TPA: hypothetical protein VHH53_05915, partial [Pseudonocardiaceae bacterium]|nr:hypothetical protein [Pseudonocardiaceae bacterium]
MPETPAKSATWSWFGGSTEGGDTAEIPQTAETVDFETVDSGSRNADLGNVEAGNFAAYPDLAAQTEGTPRLPPWDD